MRIVGDRNACNRDAHTREGCMAYWMYMTTHWRTIDCCMWHTQLRAAYHTLFCLPPDFEPWSKPSGGWCGHQGWWPDTGHVRAQGSGVHCAWRAWLCAAVRGGQGSVWCAWQSMCMAAWQCATRRVQCESLLPLAACLWVTSLLVHQELHYLPPVLNSRPT